MIDPHFLGSYILLSLLFAAVAVWPERTIEAAVYVSMVIQLFFMRVRMAFGIGLLIFKMRRQFRSSGLPVPPFKWSMLWPSLDKAS
jgi:hypothetical protein